MGQLVRERYGAQARLTGFSTYRGTVTAASRWDGQAERKRVRPALPAAQSNASALLLNQLRLLAHPPRWVFHGPRAMLRKDRVCPCGEPGIGRSDGHDTMRALRRLGVIAIIRVALAFRGRVADREIALDWSRFIVRHVKSNSIGIEPGGQQRFARMLSRFERIKNSYDCSVHVIPLTNRIRFDYNPGK